MLIGVPKEIKIQEYRVGLVPEAVAEYVRHGHAVVVERDAGMGAGLSDQVYRKAGATIAGSAEEVFSRAEMIVKVKEPQPEEWARLRVGQVLFAYLHLASDPKQAEGLLASGCTAVAYETVTDASGRLPLLAPMSEVAGRLSIEAAAFALRKPAGDKGKLLGGVPGVPPACVVVLGGGVVGTQAARMAAGLGADVTIIDRSLPRLRELDDIFAGRVKTLYSTAASIDRVIRDADVVIGAVLIPGASAPKLVSRAQLSELEPATVLVDVAIDQGGCFETSHPTTHDAPTYVVDDVIHYCVANMPGSVPQTSSYALNNATLPFGLQLADCGLDVLNKDDRFQMGLNVHRGRITNLAVAQSLNHDFTEPAVALSLH